MAFLGCLLRKRINLFASDKGASFTDDDLKPHLFWGTSLEVEKEAVTESREQHGVDIRKRNVIAFIEKSSDLGGKNYHLDPPNPGTEMDIGFGDFQWMSLSSIFQHHFRRSEIAPIKEGSRDPILGRLGKGR